MTKYSFIRSSEMSLRSKMLLLFGGGPTVILVLIQLVQLFGLPLFDYEGGYAQQSKKIYTETQAIADNEKNLMALWFAERLNDLRVLSKQEIVEHTLLYYPSPNQNSSVVSKSVDGHDHKQELQQHLEAIRSAYGFYDVIDIVSKTGEILASTKISHVNEQHALANRFFPKSTFSGNQKIILKKRVGEDSPVLYIAERVQIDGNVEPIGAVVFQISTDVLTEQNLMAERKLGATGEVILIDMHQTLLTALDHPLQDGTIAKPLEYVLQTKAAKFAAWGVDSLIESMDYRGVDVIAAVRHIRLTEDFAISMIINRNKADLYAPVWNTLFIFMAISFAGVVALIGLVIFVSKQLASPLEQLSRATNLIDRGDLSARVPGLTGVEASSLAHAFNSMAENIEKSQNTLQEQVALRTEALQALSVRQEAILTAVPDILVEIDSELHYSWSNRSGLAFFGAGIIGSPISLYFATPQDTEDQIQLLFRGSAKLLYLESMQKRYDGSVRVLAWRCKAIINDAQVTTAVLATARDITEGKWAEKELQKREERFRDLLDNIPDLVWLKDVNGVYLACNATFERLFDTKSDKIIGKTDYNFVDRELADSFRIHDKNAIAMRKSTSNEEWVVFPGNMDPTLLYTTKTPMYEKTGEFIGVLGVARDITEIKKTEEEKRKLQEQLQQAQKIEAVGRLAGGVAHDFNNMLSVILGHAELALEQLPPRDPVVEDIEEIITAANRSGSLTRQLLAFARKQTITPQIFDLNSCIEGTLSMLRRLIGENIELSWKPSQQEKIVKIDPTQIEQILANLCINSKDAIADTGNITIITGSITFDKKFCETHPYFLPRTYVTLIVIDNGSGMSLETQENMFEPFYTTKEQGKGTGLGLATVHGIVKQNKGAIDVVSHGDTGTTFTIYLPEHHAGDLWQVAEEEEEHATEGNETILIIEDEPTLLEMTVRMLEQAGYKVYGVTTPDKAMEYARKYQEDINLIITDVIMPEMNGLELTEKLKTIVPECECLFMSGYTADVIAKHGVLDEGVHFIAKPFSRGEFTVKVRSILDTMTYS